VAVDEFDATEQLHLNVEQNVEQIVPMLPADEQHGEDAGIRCETDGCRFDGSDVGALTIGDLFDGATAAQRAYVRLHGDVMRRRQADGHVRDGHGDLHLQQMALEPSGNLAIIDCIEFNSAFRIGDTALDIAFPIMDIREHGLDDLENAFLDEYLRDVTGEDEQTVRNALLPLFVSYRAMVRCKVELFQRHQDEAWRYLRASHAAFRPSLLRHGLPLIVVVAGGIGTGKSSCAQALQRTAATTSFRVCSDAVRAAMFPDDEGNHEWGEGEKYAPAATARVYTTMLDRALAHVGGADGVNLVLLDGSYRAREQRERVRTAAAEHPMHPSVLVLHVVCTDLAERERRVSARTGTDCASDGRLCHLRAQAAATDEMDDGAENVVTVDTAGLTVREAGRRALEAVLVWTELQAQ
jgi:predicted kinase